MNLIAYEENNSGLELWMIIEISFWRWNEKIWASRRNIMTNCLIECAVKIIMENSQSLLFITFHLNFLNFSLFFLKKMINYRGREKKKIKWQVFCPFLFFPLFLWGNCRKRENNLLGKKKRGLKRERK